MPISTAAHHPAAMHTASQRPIATPRACPLRVQVRCTPASLDSARCFVAQQPGTVCWLGLGLRLGLGSRYPSPSPSPSPSPNPNPNPNQVSVWQGRDSTHSEQRAALAAGRALAERLAEQPPPPPPPLPHAAAELVVAADDDNGETATNG